MAQSKIETAINNGTEQATTSGTEFDFTGIPAGTKRVTVIFDEVGLTGSDNMLVRLGDATSVEATGYISSSGDSGAVNNSTTGFIIRMTTGNLSGTMVLTRISGNSWVSSHSTKFTTSAEASGGGTKTLTGDLTRIRIIRNGSNTFNNGSANIMYEY